MVDISALLKVKKVLFINKYYKLSFYKLVAKFNSAAEDTCFALLLKQRYEKEFHHQIILPLFT